MKKLIYSSITIYILIMCIFASIVIKDSTLDPADHSIKSDMEYVTEYEPVTFMLFTDYINAKPYIPGTSRYIRSNKYLQKDATSYMAFSQDFLLRLSIYSNDNDIYTCKRDNNSHYLYYCTVNNKQYKGNLKTIIKDNISYKLFVGFDEDIYNTADTSAITLILNTFKEQ